MFYPGDVLRDTQLLNAAQKGCYLSVMCCHIEFMRFSYDLLVNITKELNESERAFFIKLFDKDDEGYYINWVVNAIEKRSKYLESRSNNKAGRPKKQRKTKKMDNDLDLEDQNKSYDFHMVNENVNEKEIVISKETEIKKNKEVQNFENKEDELKFVFKKFKEMRTKIKKPMTQYAEDMLKKKINTISGGDIQLAIEIINRSIENGWQTVYPPRDDGKYQSKEQHAQSQMFEAGRELISEYLSEEIKH